MDPAVDDRRMIFIGGLQRSGTTLIGSLLARHSGVTGLSGTHTRHDEGQFVQDVYPTDHDLGRRSARSRRGAAMRWAYNPDAHLIESDAARLRDPRERLDASWAPYWADLEAPVRVEKSPSNMLRARFLQALYPTARFILVTRHPVVQALAVRKWATIPVKLGWNFASIIDHWVTAMDIFAGDRPYLTHSMTVAYEALTAHPQKTLADVQAFCGLDAERISTDEVAGSNDDYAKYWRWMQSPGSEDDFGSPTPGARPRDNLYRSVERLVLRATGPSQARHIVEAYGTRVARYGYSFDSFDPSSSASALPGR